jgi:hypothetical protein
MIHVPAVPAVSIVPNNRIHAPDIGLFNRDVALVPTTPLKLLDEHSETFGTVGTIGTTGTLTASERIERFERLDPFEHRSAKLLLSEVLRGGLMPDPLVLEVFSDFV